MQNRTGTVVQQFAHAALRADARHYALCLKGERDDALDDAMEDYAVAMRALATAPATCSTDLRAKAAALEMAIVMNSDGYTPEITGDFGVAASLIRDVLALPETGHPVYRF